MFLNEVQMESTCQLNENSYSFFSLLSRFAHLTNSAAQYLWTASKSKKERFSSANGFDPPFIHRDHFRVKKGCEESLKEEKSTNKKGKRSQRRIFRPLYLRLCQYLMNGRLWRSGVSSQRTPDLSQLHSNWRFAFRNCISHHFYLWTHTAVNLREAWFLLNKRQKDFLTHLNSSACIQGQLNSSCYLVSPTARRCFSGIRCDADQQMTQNKVSPQTRKTHVHTQIRSYINSGRLESLTPEPFMSTRTMNTFSLQKIFVDGFIWKKKKRWRLLKPLDLVYAFNSNFESVARGCHPK